MKLKLLLVDSCALLVGAMLTLAFAPFSLFPLAIISPALLLFLLLSTTPLQAFWRGWLYGIGLFGSGVYWVYISIHNFGNASIFLAALITGLFIALLALFPAFTSFLLTRYFPLTHPAKLLYAFPAIWVLLEWVRSWIFTGFPWLTIGYSQINSPLRGFAPLFSVYGVSFAVILSSALLVSILIHIKQKKPFYRYCLVLLLLWLVGGYLSKISWTHSQGTPLQVSLVQGNITQYLKWSPDEVLPTLIRYQELTEKHWDSKIIIWPEAAIPIALQDAQSFIEAMHQKAKQHQTTLITGIPIKDERKNAYYNAVIALGNGRGVYLKQRLVPFGEYTPAIPFLTHLLTLFNIPMSDVIPSPHLAQPLFADNIKIATFICYEIAFPEQVLSRDGHIDVLLTVSDDAWFGHSIAQAQHLEMAQMRALEMGRPVLFVSNNGITAIINSHGKIQAAAQPYQPAVLTDKIQTTTGKTPWQLFALDPLLMLMLVLLAMAVRLRNKSESK